MAGKPVILLVDDEEMVLNALTRLLKREDDYEIITSIRAYEALDMVKDMKIDLVVSDQCMPGMTGVEFLSKMREIHPEAIRFLVSGYADFDDLVAAINQAQIHRFIIKPWDNKEFLELIKKAVSDPDKVRHGASF